MARLGYDALTEDEFIDRITQWYMYHTGMGTNLLLMTAISFIVGLSISGQAFYSFTLENLEKFGALKAIGAKGRELVPMLLFQALITALAGYGLGIGLCAALIALARLKAPRLRVDHHLRQPRPRLRDGLSSPRSPATSPSARC